MTTPINQISSIHDLLDILTIWESDNPTTGRASDWIWYRGQPDKQFSLSPAVERDDFVATAKENGVNPDFKNRPLEYELEINADYLRMGSQLFDTRENFVRAYFSAQHYGLPTRLLDWTTNPLVALFFAVTENSDKDGKLFVVKKNQIGNKNPKKPTNERDPEVVLTINRLFGKFGKGDLPGDPGIIPILPDLSFPRMLQQSSCFTLHMPGSEPLRAENSPPSLTEYIIKSDCKEPVERQLSQLGITKASLFPELAGVAENIKRAHKLIKRKGVEP